MYLTPAFLFAAAVFLGSSLVSNTYGLVQPAVRAELGVSPTLAGAIFSLYALLFAIGSRTAGRLAERFDTPTALRSGLGVALAGHGIALGLDTSLGVALGFALIGLGEGWAMTMTSALVSARFVGRRSQALSVLEVAFSVGAIATPAIVAFLAGWRSPYVLSSAVLVALVLASLAPGMLPRAAELAPVEPADASTLGRGGAVSTGLLVCLFAAGVEWGGSVWLPSFLVADGALDAGDAALAMSLLWAGFLVSRLAGIAAFTRFDVDVTLVVAAALAVLGALLVVAADARPLVLVGAVLLGLGSGCVFPGILGRLVDLDPTRAASVTGTALALTAVAGIAFPFVLGAAADVVGIERAAWLLPGAAIATFVALLAWWRASGDRASAPET